MTKRLLILLAALAPLAGCETSNGGSSTSYPSYGGATGSTSDIADFVGAKGGQAEGGLNNRGYQFARSQGLTSFWWNQNTQTCARIVTSDGRYQSIDTATRSDCGK